MYKNAKIQLDLPRLSSHPWVYAKHLRKIEEIRNGCVADLVDKDGTFLARGFYNGHARIGFRTLTRDVHEVVDQTFFRKRLAQAAVLRRTLRPELARTEKAAWRLCNGEGDCLSGLVIDIFADLGVVQFYASGPHRFRDQIIEILRDDYGCTSFYWFAEKHIQKQESFDCRYAGEAPSTTISEDGVLFRVAPNLNHKTGFFLDQRRNRRQLAALSQGKSVLDLCCFTGGFAISAATAGAAQVTAIDLDPEAIASMEVNAQLNECSATVTGISADVYTWLTESTQQFDVVVLDPAKLTKSSERLEQALKQYTHLNTLAIKRVQPGGLLLTCSCSGLVSENDFIDCVRRAAIHAERSVQIFALSGASEDHPYLSDALTGRYLKAVWCRIL